MIARDLNGSRLFASGAGFEKGDVRVKRAYKKVGRDIVPSDALTFRIEAKTTQRSAYSFKVQDWIDIRRSAARDGEHPLFALQFLATSMSYVLILSSLAIELRLRNPSFLGIPKLVERSWSIDYDHLTKSHQRTIISCTGLGARQDVLVLLPYDDFLEAVKAYAPNG